MARVNVEFPDDVASMQIIVRGLDVSQSVRHGKFTFTFVCPAVVEDEDIDRVWSTSDVSIVTVVGVGMRHTVGVAGKVFSQLGNNNVNVLAIAQGSSEVSISLVVDSADTENAVKSLHELIVEKEPSTQVDK